MSLGTSSYFLELPYFCLVCLCDQKIVFLKQTLKSEKSELPVEILMFRGWETLRVLNLE